MGEYAGATDLRRRSFLKLLGLAGVAAAMPMELLIEPEAAVVEAAHAANIPVSGDFFWVTTQKHARRIGKILNVTFENPLPDMHVDVMGNMHPGLAMPPEIHMDLVDCDVQAVHNAMFNREQGKSELYLFDRKFTVANSFFSEFAHGIPAWASRRAEFITRVTIIAAYPNKPNNPDYKFVTVDVI